MTTHPTDPQADSIRDYIDVPQAVTMHGARYLYGETDSVPIEFVWELVRQREFPERPTRLGSVFCFADATAAALFGKHGSPHGFGNVWEIEAADDTACFDMRWLDRNNSFVTMISNAQHYWQRDASESPIWEYLVQPSTARVVGKLGTTTQPS